jgi:hypothetical protein
LGVLITLLDFSALGDQFMLNIFNHQRVSLVVQWLSEKGLFARPTKYLCNYLQFLLIYCVTKFHNLIVTTGSFCAGFMI